MVYEEIAQQLEGKVSYERIIPEVRLGAAPPKSDSRLLMASNFLDTETKPPDRTEFWKERAPFPLRTFGNLGYGNCTKASQALAALRSERKEQRRTIQEAAAKGKTAITDEEVIRVYKEMTSRLYGADWQNNPVAADTGAYELDALNEWRRKEYTFRDTKGRPYTIDAFAAINHRSIKAVKNALANSQGAGIKVCFALPWAWAGGGVSWEVPEGVRPIGTYLPGSWGYHSMYADDYDEQYLYLPSTWAWEGGRISWEAFSYYATEAYLFIDSLNHWKIKKAKVDLAGIKKAVNEVSSLQIV